MIKFDDVRAMLNNRRITQKEIAKKVFRNEERQCVISRMFRGQLRMTIKQAMVIEKMLEKKIQWNDILLSHHLFYESKKERKK